VPNGGMAFGHFYGDFGDQAVHRTGQHGIAFFSHPISPEHCRFHLIG